MVLHGGSFDSRVELAFMRIIAGTFRHRPLKSPPFKTTRPITDRVKQSVFDALVTAVGFDGVRVLDVFAGTGSIGLECLSRGAREVVFIEQDHNALFALRNNIDALGVRPSSRVLAADVFKCRDIWSGAMGRFDLIFFDPPYPLFNDAGTASDLDAAIGSAVNGALNETGALLLRTQMGLDMQSLEISKLIRRRQDYGSMSMHWLTRSSTH